MLTNLDLEAIAKYLKLKDFRGVFSKDELPVRKKEGSYIINLENSVNEKGKPLGGTHWTCFRLYENKKEYFDSFGVVFPLEVEKYMGFPIEYNEKQIQDFNSVNCGWFCVAYLYFAERKVSMNKFQKMFCDDTAENDRILKNYIQDILN